MSRRSFLAVLALGIAATAPNRVRASTEVEGAAYGGSTAGGWVCGPVGRANYGGVGARVRVAEHEARFGGSGFTGDLAAAGEAEATTITDCMGGSDCPSGTRRSAMYGGHARVGYQWETIGVRAGVTAYQGYGRPADDSPTASLFPDAEVSFGSADVFRGVVGIGSPTVTTLRRPGAYLGADVPAGDIDVEVRAGAFRAGPALGDSFGARGDVAVYVPVGRAISLRLGASASGNKDGPGAEASAGVRGAL